MPEQTAEPAASAIPVSMFALGEMPASRAVPMMAIPNEASVTPRMRSPRTGTASKAADTAYSGATNPVTVGPASATATLVAAMNTIPPKPERTTAATCSGR